MPFFCKCTALTVRLHPDSSSRRRDHRDGFKYASLHFSDRLNPVTVSKRSLPKVTGNGLVSQRHAETLHRVPTIVGGLSAVNRTWLCSRRLNCRGNTCCVLLFLRIFKKLYMDVKYVQIFNNSLNHNVVIGAHKFLRYFLQCYTKFFKILSGLRRSRCQGVNLATKSATSEHDHCGAMASRESVEEVTIRHDGGQRNGALTISVDKFFRRGAHDFALCLLFDCFSFPASCVVRTRQKRGASEQ